MTYMFPFAKGVGYISQRFGTNPNNGINPRKGHTGDDWAVSEGTPIYAAADGVIEVSGWPDANYLNSNYWLTAAAGDALVLNCGRGKPSFIYGHNSETAPPVGMHVKKGQIISLSGNSGLSTGPHSHVEVVLDGFDLMDGSYGRTDPLSLFDEWYEEEKVFAMAGFTPEEEWYQAMIGAQARIDARTLYVKGDKDATVYDITGGIPRALTLPEFTVLRQANQPLKEMDQKLIDDFISDYNARTNS